MKYVLGTPFITLYLFGLYFSIFDVSVSARTSFDKQECEGADFCTLDTNVSSGYGTQAAQHPVIKFYSSGEFIDWTDSQGLSHYDEESHIYPVDVEKRLGLGACCRGEFANLKRSSENLADPKANQTGMTEARSVTPLLPYVQRFLEGLPGDDWLSKASKVGGTAVGVNAAYDLVKKLYADGVWLLAGKGQQEACETVNFYDAKKQDMTLKGCIVNEGVCSTTATYDTIFDGVSEALDYMTGKDCQRCCTTISHGGDWQAQIKMVTENDRIDPCKINCDRYNRHVCKINENGDTACSRKHDEL